MNSSVGSCIIKFGVGLSFLGMLLAMQFDITSAQAIKPGYENLIPDVNYKRSKIKLHYPEGAYKIRSVFGDRYARPPGYPKSRRRNRHTGIDIYAPIGTPVYAAEPGVVESVYDRVEGGKTIWLAISIGGKEIALYYLHLSKSLVAEGDEVSAGQVIGAVGKTGDVAAAHLHFEVTSDEGWYDPAKFLLGADGFIECVEPEKDYSGRSLEAVDSKRPLILYPVACTK